MENGGRKSKTPLRRTSFERHQRTSEQRSTFAAERAGKQRSQKQRRPSVKRLTASLPGAAVLIKRKKSIKKRIQYRGSHAVVRVRSFWASHRSQAVEDTCLGLQLSEPEGLQGVGLQPENLADRLL
eukprot:1160054-Pelagomonas_calceolata.AAC.13